MDNLTHSLVGLVAAKAGLERLSPAATTMCVIAANAPDADILARFGGSWFYLHHHRGITHSIIGTFAIALLIPILFWLGDFLIARLRGRKMTVKLSGMLLVSLIVSATHPLLDWTNNYGVRPLLPWSGKWFYGDLVFIVDPWLWLSLGGTAFLLTAKTKWRIALWVVLALVLTGAIVYLSLIRPDSIFPVASCFVWLIGVVGFFVAHRARLAERFGVGIAVCALALMLVYWSGLSLLHRRALAQAQAVATNLAAANGETVMRSAAMPTLANPLRWQCVTETTGATLRFDFSLSEQGIVGETIRYQKPQGKAAEAYARAAQNENAGIFLNFARFPVSRMEGDCLSKALVQIADLRYTEPGRSAPGSFSIEVPVECAPAGGVTEAK